MRAPPKKLKKRKGRSGSLLLCNFELRGEISPRVFLETESKTQALDDPSLHRINRDQEIGNDGRHRHPLKLGKQAERFMDGRIESDSDTRFAGSHCDAPEQK